MDHDLSIYHLLVIYNLATPLPKMSPTTHHTDALTHTHCTDIMGVVTYSPLKIASLSNDEVIRAPGKDIMGVVTYSPLNDEVIRAPGKDGLSVKI